MHSDFQDYTDGEQQFEAFIAHQDFEGKKPCVIVCHAWGGQSEFEREKATDLAKLGYVGFAADVYGKGLRGAPLEDNTHLMQPMMDDRAKLLRRLKLTVATAAALPFVDPHRIAVVGYCFGGLCALDLARSNDPSIKAAISFHGVFAPPNLGTQEPIKAKVLILHGYDDPWAKPEELVGVAKELSAAKADWQIHAYGNTVHAFTVPSANAPDSGILYSASADQRSWQAMKNLLAEIFVEAPKPFRPMEPSLT